jgi:multidrug efflux pump
MSWRARPTNSACLINSLRTLQVPLPGGRTVPLSQFASFEYEQEYPLVWRRDRMPT